MLTRREFLETGKLLVLGGTAHRFLGPLSGRLLASEGMGIPKQLMIISVYGGADCTVGLDPWIGERPHPEDLYLDEDYEVIPHAGGTDIHLGPSAIPLLDLVDNMAIICGITMGTEDFGHNTMINYMATADMVGGNPYFIARLAKSYRAKTKRKNNGENIVFNSDLPTYGIEGVTKVPVASFTRSVSDNTDKMIDELGPFFTDTSSFGLAYDTMIQERKDRQALLNDSSGLDVGSQMDRIGDRLGLARANLEAEHTATAAFAADYARFALIDWRGNNAPRLDTHAGFPENHQTEQRRLWERVASLINLLKETPYLDTDTPLFPNVVTLAVTTEFSRPPFLNRNRGKDHNEKDNAILLAGRGIRGGTKVGHHNLFERDGEKREVSQLSGGDIDYRTGEPIPYDAVNKALGHDLIRPKNILKTIGDLYGLGDELMPGVQSLPGIVKA